MKVEVKLKVDVLINGVKAETKKVSFIVSEERVEEARQEYIKQGQAEIDKRFPLGTKGIW